MWHITGPDGATDNRTRHAAATLRACSLSAGKIRFAIGGNRRGTSLGLVENVFGCEFLKNQTPDMLVQRRRTPSTPILILDVQRKPRSRVAAVIFHLLQLCRRQMRQRPSFSCLRRSSDVGAHPDLGGRTKKFSLMCRKVISSRSASSFSWQAGQTDRKSVV